MEREHIIKTAKDERLGNEGTIEIEDRKDVAWIRQLILQATSGGAGLWTSILRDSYAIHRNGETSYIVISLTYVEGILHFAQMTDRSGRVCRALR